jgi:tetratricopeptide (TPR) repeat protein
MLKHRTFIFLIASLLTFFLVSPAVAQVRGIVPVEEFEELLDQMEDQIIRSSDREQVASIPPAVSTEVDPIKEIKELNALGKYEEAVRYAEGVATLNPNQSKIYTWWGISLVKSGKRKEAIEKFIKSADLDANYSKNYLYWGLTLAMDGKAKAAIKKYENVIELEPENSNAYAYWGAALNQLGQYAKAEDKLKRALEILPNNANAFGVLIDVLSNQKKYDEARQTAKRAKELKESSLQTLDRFARLAPKADLKDYPMPEVDKFSSIKEKLGSLGSKHGIRELDIFFSLSHDSSFKNIYTVIPSAANIRSNPSMTASVIAVVEQGMYLDVIEINQDWTKVRVFEKTGWISNRLIKVNVEVLPPSNFRTKTQREILLQ